MAITGPEGWNPEDREAAINFHNKETLKNGTGGNRIGDIEIAHEVAYRAKKSYDKMSEVKDEDTRAEENRERYRQDGDKVVEFAEREVPEDRDLAMRYVNKLSDPNFLDFVKLPVRKGLHRERYIEEIIDQEFGFTNSAFEHPEEFTQPVVVNGVEKYFNEDEKSIYYSRIPR